MDNQIRRLQRRMLSTVRGSKKWRRIVSTLSCVVVFCTTYALILPAITATKPTYCGLEEHTHTSECGVSVLTCTLPEEANHVHTTDCYSTNKVLICDLPESAGHVHTEACNATSTLRVCGYEEESEVHTHTAECFETRTYVGCGLNEDAGHTHTDSCYTMQETLTCNPHVHGSGCYTQETSCGKVQHTHTEKCYEVPDETETQNVDEWKKKLPDTTGHWANDLLAAVRSQMGYTESAVDKDETGNGRTFYGEAYGVPYANWDAAFVSWALEQIGVPKAPTEEVPAYFPQNGNTEYWTADLQSRGLFHEGKEGWNPRPGDLMFFSVDGGRGFKRVSVVVEASFDEEGKLSTVRSIMGDCEDKVDDIVWNVSALNIQGWARLPQNPDYDYGDEVLVSPVQKNPEQAASEEDQVEETGIDLSVMKEDAVAWIEELLASGDLRMTEGEYLPGDILFCENEAGEIYAALVRSAQKDEAGLITTVQLAWRGAEGAVEQETVPVEELYLAGWLRLPEEPEQTDVPPVDEDDSDLSDETGIVGGHAYALFNAGSNYGIMLLSEGHSVAPYIPSRDGVVVTWHEHHDTPEDATMTWKPITDLPATGLPANAHLQFNINYSGVDPIVLRDSGYKLTYTPGSVLKHLSAQGSIMVAGKSRGVITATGESIILEFDKDWVDGIIQENATAGSGSKQSVGGDFMFQGTLDLSKVDQDGNIQLNLPGLEKNIKTDGDAVAKYADVDVDKTLAGELKEKDGHYYMEYTLTVTASAYGSPAVTVRDTFTTGGAYLDKTADRPGGYVGVTTTRVQTASSGDPLDQGKPVETVKDGAAVARQGEVYLNAGNSMVWDLGDMAPNEERTLTYVVALKDSYIGLPHQNQSIRNKADAYSKEFPHGSSVTEFAPKAGADLHKAAGTPYDKDGKTYIDYTVRITANADNSYPLTNFKLNDSLKRAENDDFRSQITYDRDSIKLYTDSRLSNRITDLAQYHTGPRPGYKGTENPYIGNDDNSFELYVGDLNPGESRWVTYTMEIDVPGAQSLHAGPVGIFNRAELYADDTKNGGFVNGYNTNNELSDIQWSRKMQGDKLAVNSNFTIPAGSTVYDKSGNRSVIASEQSFAVRRGGQRYTVVVNESGEWDMSAASLGDALGTNAGQNIFLFAGYVRIDVYDQVDASGGEQAVRDRLAQQTPKETVWVDVDNLTSFGFTGSSLGLSGDDAYVMTYYTNINPNVSDFGEAIVGNTFSISGNVIGPGGENYKLVGVRQNVSVKVRDPGMGDFTKDAWYYDKDDTSFAKYNLNHGAVYWVISYDGSRVYKNYIVQESSNYSPYNNSVRKYESSVGLYSANLGVDENGVDRKLTDVYANITEFLADVQAGKITELTQGTDYDLSTESERNDEAGLRSYDMDLTFKNNMDVPFGEKLYWVVRTEPAVLPSNGYSQVYKNKIHTKPAGSPWNDTVDWDSLRLTSPNGSLKKTSDGVFSVSNNGTKFQKFDAQKGKFVDVNTTNPDAVLQTSTLCVDKDFQRIAKNGKSPYRYLDGTYILWNVTLNDGGTMDGSSYTITDTLPAGVELAYVRPSYINFDGNLNTTNFPGDATWYAGGGGPENILAVKDSSLIEAGWTEHRTQSSLMGSNTSMNWNRMGIFYYTKGDQITIRTPILRGTEPNGSTRMSYQIVCRVTDTDIYFTDVSKTNTATLTDEDGNEVESDSNTVTIFTPNLSKSMLATLSPTGSLTSGIIPYSVAINELGQEVDAKGNTITVPLVDVMSPQLTISMDTMMIYIDSETAANLIYDGISGNKDVTISHPDGETSKPQIRISVEKTYDSNGVPDGRSAVKFHNLPDNHKLIIKYDVSAALSSEVQDGQGTNSFSNLAYWEGYKVPEGGNESVENMQYKASATAYTMPHGGLKITKHAGENESTRLSGAEFSLYRALYVTHGDGKLVWLGDEGSGTVLPPMTEQQMAEYNRIKTLHYPAVYDVATDTELKVLRDTDGHMAAWWNGDHWDYDVDSLDAIHKFDYDENTGKLRVYTDDLLARKATGSNGEVSYGLAGDEDRIHFNKVYAIIETKAPEGYDIDPTPHFFVIPSTTPKQSEGSYFFHEDWPDEVHVCSRYAGNTPTYFLDVFDYKGSVQVQKSFSGNIRVDGFESDVLAGTYRFGIWEAAAVEENGVLSPALLTPATMMKDANGNPYIQSITFTPDEIGKYLVNPKTATFADLAFNRSYYVFEVNSSGYPVMNGTTGMAENGNEFYVNYTSKQDNTSQDPAVAGNKVMPVKEENTQPVTPIVIASNEQYIVKIEKRFEGIREDFKAEMIPGTYYFGIQQQTKSGDWSRVLDVRTLTITAENLNESHVAIFTGLEPGLTYRIVELASADPTDIVEMDDRFTAENGTSFLVKYPKKDDGQGGQIILPMRIIDGSISTAVITNVNYSAQVTKQFRGLNGEILDHGLVGKYEFGLWEKNADSNYTAANRIDEVTISWETLSDLEASKTAYFTGLRPDQEYMIFELDDNGDPVIEGDSIKNGSGLFVVGYGSNVPGQPNSTGTLSSTNNGNVTVTNMASIALPNSGGMGTQSFTYGGIALVSIACLGYIVCLLRRRREEVRS